MNKGPNADKRGFAEVITWGTEFAGGNGMMAQMRAKLKGGNIGHAAVRLTIPADESSKALIEQYCYHQNNQVLPFEKRKLPNGEAVYEVYISAWSNDSVTLDRDFISDSQEERAGVHFHMDPKWEALLKPEKRSYKGLVGRTTMTLGPEEIIHQRGNLSDAQMVTFQQITEFKQYHKEVKNHDLLIRRLNQLAQQKNPKLDGTAVILLDRLCPDWQSKVSKPPKLTVTETNALIDEAKLANVNYTNSPESSRIKEAANELAVKDLTEIKSMIASDIKKWGHILPKTAEVMIEKQSLLGQICDYSIAKIINLKADECVEINQKIQNMIYLGPNENNVKYYYESYQPADNQMLEQSFSIGLPPDHILQIPIESLHNPKNDGALNLEAMLKRAKQVAISNEEFSLTGTNCSKVAGWVLQAGTQNSKAGKIFDRSAWSIFATPQMVFNNATKYLRNISKKADQNYNQLVKAQSAKQAEEKVVKQLPLPGFVEISFNSTDKNQPTKEQCAALLDKFETAIKSGNDIPYLETSEKLKLESAIKGDTQLQTRFYSLCDKAINKANKQSIQNQAPKENEWDIASKLIVGDKSQKISRKAHPELAHSYIFMEVNGQNELFRVSRDILGKGQEGKVKVIENQKGERSVIKVVADKPSLDSEIGLMKGMGAAKGDFVRERESKFSKTMGHKIGNKRTIIQPLHEGGELQALLKKRTLTEEQKIAIARECCLQILKMHDKNILHRDIKGANFMAAIDDNGNVKSVNAIDFGGAIKCDQQGQVLAKPFGSPAYMAPELGSADMQVATRELYKQIGIGKNFGNLISEAKVILEQLNSEKRKVRGELTSLEDRMFEIDPGNLSIFKRDKQDDVLKILEKYDGTNEAEIFEQLKAFTPIEAYHSMAKSSVRSYCEAKDKVMILEKRMGEYQGKIQDYQNNLDISQQKVEEQRSILKDKFGQQVTNSVSSDVYALGVMIKNEFGLDLASLGLNEMLENDSSKRPKLIDIISKLDKKLVKENVQQQQPTAIAQSVNKGPRLPKAVDLQKLHNVGNNQFSLLTAKEMIELSTKRIGKENSYILINNVTIFLTKEGGAFAMHSPIGGGATASTFLVQNLEDQSWSVLKMVKGRPMKIRGPLAQLNIENKALSDFQQLNGTLEMAMGPQEMHISIQPYAHGMEYTDVIKMAAKDGSGLPIEDTVLMSLKALEALADLHENHHYLHRDIKPQNMMWDPVAKQCVLIDFGCAGKCENDSMEISDITKRGSEAYQAPEIEFGKLIKKDRKYSDKTDMYSLGIVIQELIEKTRPDDQVSLQQLKDLQTRMTSTDPANRPNARTAFQEVQKIAQSLVIKGSLAAEIVYSKESNARSELSNPTLERKASQLIFSPAMSATGAKDIPEKTHSPEVSSKNSTRLK